MLALEFNPFPTLTTDRLQLRKLEMSDAPEVFAIRSDDRVNHFLDRPKANSIDDARSFIEKIQTYIKKNESAYWVITMKDHPKLVGTITLWNIVKEESKAEIGYELLPAYQGKGIMQEALTAVLQFSFDVLKFKTIEAFTHSENGKSSSLLEKNNFKRDFAQEEKMRTEGTLDNLVIYYLTHD